MAGRQVTVEFLGNSRNLIGAVDRAESRTSRLGSTLKRIGKSAAIGFAGAAIVAGKALWDMGEAAAADEASASQLARQLKNNTKATNDQIAAVEDWILATSLASGVADDDLRPALAKLATATGDVKKAQDLLTLGMNISAGTGKDLKTVTDALAKAQNGSLGGLSRLGVKIKDAAGETKTFAAIQDDLAKKFKGATAQAAETTAGKMARLKVQMSETGEAIGYKLLPYALRFATWMLNSGIPAVQKIAHWLKDKLGPAFSAVIDWFRKGSKSGGDLNGVMDDLASIVDDARRAWVVIGPPLKEAAKVYFPYLAFQIKIVIKGLRTWADVMIWLWNNVTAPTLRFMLNAFGDVNTAIGKMLTTLGHVPGFGWAKKLGNDLLAAGDKAHTLANNIRNIPDRKTVTVTVTTHYTSTGKPTPAAPGVQPERHATRNPTVQVGQAALDMVTQVIAAIAGKKKKLQDVLAGVRDAISTAKDQIASILEDKKAWAEGFQDFVGNIFSADFSDPESGAYTGTVEKIIAYQQEQLQKALQLQADIQSLVDKGLSPQLLSQLQAAGASGVAQIHTLAGASAGQIAQLNSLQSQTAGALSSAGQKASDVVFKDQLQVANQQLNQLQAVNSVLTQIAESLGKDDKAVVRLDGQTLEIVFRRREKATGRKLLVSPA
jgi:hypothetical protein